MHSSRFVLGLLLGGWLLTACQPTANGVDPAPAPTAPVPGIPTEVGKPLGSPIQKTIGPAGGSLSTADNALTLIIPPGALKKDTLITVQPVENKAPGGTGLGYAFSPQNLELAKPAELVWNYQVNDVEGSAPEALGLAVQQPDRTWLGRRDIILNKASRKASARVNKLQPAAFYEQYYMEPAKASLALGESQQLTVYFQSGRRELSDNSTIDDFFTPLTTPEALKAADVKNWRVNGQDLAERVDIQLGHLTPNQTKAEATYLVPGAMPEKNKIAVSVEVLLTGTNAKLMLVSNLTIEGANGFKLNGVTEPNAALLMFMVAHGQAFQVGMAEGSHLAGEENVALVSMSIKQNFTGTGTYTASGSDDSQLFIEGQDRNKKSWSSVYYPRTGGQVVGPLTVKITDYDREKKKVAGQFSGTLHYYDSKTDKHETTSVSGHFRAASL
ncbi:hypothetical protein [Fibrella aquatilis]|uniref:ZU5 domain-containing protein n=1 Tax=Fibrella aquatilis TaxID=2817059 RepID=A0A939G798_9BACT|nr:hypothetical protein [Fibrella aquatilis]MBO0932518.1 hypothetical protein [Fibrella aquatilis]